MEQLEPVQTIGATTLTPVRGISEIFEYTASKFGVTVDMLIDKKHSGKEPIHIPRNVAVLVCLANGHMPGQIARFLFRDYSVTRTIRLRTLGKPEQVRMAWQVARELGVTWEAFSQMRGSSEALEPPATSDFVIPTVSKTDAFGNVEGIPTYFNASFTLSKRVTDYLGITEGISGESSICCGLIRQAVTDYLIGLDAKKWIDSDMETSASGVTFEEACEGIKLNPGWLRRKLEKLAELLKRTQEHDDK